MNRKAIGKRIASLRTRRGMSTAQLADAIGKSQATVSRIENGKQGAAIEVIEQIARILDVDPLFLLTENVASIVRNQMVSTGEPVDAAAQDSVCALGRGLLRARLGRGLTPEEAAIQLDIRDEDLDALEHGRAFPSPQLIERMKAVYGINSKEIYGLTYLKEIHPELSLRIGQMEQFLDMFLSFFGSHDLQKLMRTDVDAVIAHFSRKLSEANQKPDRAPAPAAQHAPATIAPPLMQAKSAPAQTPPAHADAQGSAPAHYSIEHLSDRLLKCLQDEEFFRICESLSRVYENEKKPVPPPPAKETVSKDSLAKVAQRRFNG